MAVAEAKTQIGFEHVGLGSVLKHNQLEVPPNQREYAWTTDQVTQLFQDFARAMNNGDYFLGTVVTIPRIDGTLEVVDGQQRLATTAILLAAIRDYLMGKNEALLVESINDEFLTGIDRTRRERVSKLKLNIADNELFNQIVSDGPRDFPAKQNRRSHDLLIDAYLEAQKHVKRSVSLLDPRDHGDELNRWVTFIQHQALVVLLRVPDDADAYRMFETLNDRGLRTSQVDLIKNYLFSRAGGRLAEVQNRWSYMRGALDTLEDEDVVIDFLRHALIVLSGPVREADVYARVQELAKSEQGTITLTGTLETLANAYVSTFNPDHERWAGYPDTVRRAVRVLNLLNIKPARPLLLSLAAKMSKSEASAAHSFLISLGVRLMIASNTRSGSVETPLATAAHGVFDESVTTTSDLKKVLVDVTPTNEQFRVAMELARVSNARLARYYLRSLEMAWKQEPEPYFEPVENSQIITLEHVLPRKPEGNWPQFSDDDVRLHSTRLGNLVLMRASENSAFKSAGFLDKRAAYAQSSYSLTSMVGDMAEWTVDTIAGRQRELAKLAVKTWPV